MSKHNLQQLIQKISLWDDQFPEEALAILIDNEEEAKPHLRTLLEFVGKNYQTLPEEFVGHLYAVYLLAFFRDPSAFKPALELLLLPGEYPEKLLGHFLTQSYPAVIASCYGGDIEPLYQAICEQKNSELCRIVALVCLSILFHTKKIARNDLIAFFSSLLETPDTPTFHLALAEEIADLHLCELQPKVKKLYDSAIIVSDHYSFADFQAALDSDYSNPRKFFLIEDIFEELNGKEYSGS